MSAFCVRVAMKPRITIPMAMMVKKEVKVIPMVTALRELTV
jgi:hypothetical protein